MSTVLFCDNSKYKPIHVLYIIVKMEKAVAAYLQNLVGEEGLGIVEELSGDTFTDDEIVNRTGAQLSTV